MVNNQKELMLSVIVPVYNVEEFLLECMESIDASITDINAEVLLVDDGSTDTSPEIAKEFAGNHPKFKYFRKENGGLAETRNFGISHASGKYLSFIDSDDLVTEDMFEKMIASAEMHDTDVTIINVARFNKKKIFDASLYVRMFNDVDEIVTHISKCDRLIFDTIVCNKLVRRDFWIENGFEFPVGYRFEDMAVALAMHCQARRISMIKTVGYLWRVREGETRSITQENTRTVNLEHRLFMLNRMYDYIETSMGGDARLKGLLDRKVLSLDLIIYINAMAELPRKAQKEFRTILMAFFDKHYTRANLEVLSALDRQKYTDLLEGRYKEILPLRKYGKKLYYTAPIEEKDGNLFLRMDSSLFDQEYYNAENEFVDTVPRHFVDDVYYANGKMYLQMHSFFNRINTPEGKQNISAVAQNIVSGAEVDLPVKMIDGTAITERYGNVFDELTGTHHNYDYNGSAFVIEIDPNTISNESNINNSYLIIIRYNNSIKRGAFFVRTAGSAATIKELISGAVVADEDDSVEISFDVQGSVVLNAGKIRANEINELSGERQKQAFLIDSGVTDAGDIKLLIRLGEQVQDIEEGSVNLCYLDKKSGNNVVLACAESDAASDRSEIAFTLDLNRPELITNIYDVLLQLVLQQDQKTPVPINSSMEKRVTTSVDGARVSILANNSGELSMMVHNQNYLTQNKQNYNLKFIYPEYMKEPVDDKIVMFEAYWGGQYSCNPRALYEYIDANHPEYTCVCSLADERTPINGRGIRVRRGSAEYYRYLATAKYLVNNVNFENGYRKRPEQIEIQTMHGTPLKTIGLDVKEEFRTADQQIKYIKKNRRWNYLIAQGKFTEENAERWYGFNKKVLCTGYPRTDELFRITDEEKVRLKGKLGIPQNRKVILYAPTFRKAGTFDMPLNLELLKKELSDEYVLLIRLHHFVTEAYKVPADGDFIFDAGKYDSITDLYKIADILITDYSSVMFDFALTGKPMVFFAYDLEEYVSQTRGVYFDITTEGPGPIVRNNEELIKALKDGGAGNEDRVKRFREKYLTYECPDSAEKVFNEVFLNRDADMRASARTVVIRTLKKLLPKKVFRKIREHKIKREIG